MPKSATITLKFTSIIAQNYNALEEKLKRFLESVLIFHRERKKKAYRSYCRIAYSAKPYIHYTYKHLKIIRNHSNAQKWMKNHAEILSRVLLALFGQRQSL